jgi:serine/threonine protein kinase
MKGVHQTPSELNFKREISILQQCSHPNIIRLVALVLNAEDMVEGVLLEYVNNSKSLDSVNSLSKQQFDEWKVQLHEGIRHIHERGLVWGEAKPHNVLIREDDSLVIIDFGGGRTEGWVDKENYETAQGDWQGFERMFLSLSKNVSTEDGF